MIKVKAKLNEELLSQFGGKLPDSMLVSSGTAVGKIYGEGNFKDYFVEVRAVGEKEIRFFNEKEEITEIYVGDNITAEILYRAEEEIKNGRAEITNNNWYEAFLYKIKGLYADEIDSCIFETNDEFTGREELIKMFKEILDYFEEEVA